ncbi:c-type cytochrome [Mucilaginibacter sp. AW1-3]
MLQHKKTLIVTCLSAAIIFVATTAMRQAPQQEEQGFKNLKVLPKNITHDEMEKVMHEWSSAVGQRCGFCHARDAQTNKTDFASDAKPEKLMARKMMQMTEKINKKYFKEDKDEKDKGAMTAAIGCYTCHNGKPHPDAVAPARNGGGPRPGAPAAGGNPTPPPTAPPSQK